MSNGSLFNGEHNFISRNNKNALKRLKIKVSWNKKKTTKSSSKNAASRKSQITARLPDADPVDEIRGVGYNDNSVWFYFFFQALLSVLATIEVFGQSRWWSF